jgi:FMN phosphatase YigB (HAD superfamily)
MRIGIDFDNTIACYDGVFHEAALERALIPAGLAEDKTSVRDHLRRLGRDADFTELQGYVYGARMDLVALYPGLVETLRQAHAQGHELYIVSHKTKTPFAGPAYDLHAAARDFLRARAVMGEQPGQIAPERVYFELTKEDKVARVAALGCDVFIDDLPEILAMDGFPQGLRAILFDPDDHYAGASRDGRGFERCRSWAEIGDLLREA